MDKRMTLFEHLDELRRRLFIVLIGLVLTTVAGWYLVPAVLSKLLQPALAAGARFIQLSPAEGFWVYFKLAVIIGLALDSPLILHQAMAFVWPALNRLERRYAAMLLPAVIFFFLMGLSFAYFLFLGPMFRFLLGFSIPGVTPAISISSYVSFVINLVVPFGLTFQLPVAVSLLAGLGLLTPRWLASNRKYAILVIFVLAAVLTPPDPLSQIVMAVPMVGLYELSILMARLAARRRAAHLESFDQGQPQTPEGDAEEPAGQ